MSRSDRGFALFLLVVLVAIATLFYQIFPRHDQGQAATPGAGSAPSPTAAPPAK